MIVKNESKVIERALKSAKPLIDYWVIVDTGSTDGTQQIIKDFMKGIPGELHEHEWVDFAYNRNHALNLAKDKADYILIIDADEEFILDEDFKIPPLDKDYYFIRSEFNGTQYQRVQLVNSQKDWEWKGAVHEVLEPHVSMSFSILPGIINFVRFEGCVSQDPTAFLKDAQTFELSLLKNPHSTRGVFYLAQSYRDAGKPDLALHNYRRRVAMGGWPEEVFWAKYQCALLEESLEYDSEIFLQSYYNAYTYRPSRLEPLYYIVRYYRRHSRVPEAYAIAKLALEQIANQDLPDDLLFVESWIYRYGLLLELSISAYWVENYEEAKTTSLQLLEMPHLPGNVRKCVENNLKWVNSKLQPTHPETKPPQEKAKPITANSQKMDTHLEQGNQFAASKEFEKALDRYRKILFLIPDHVKAQEKFIKTLDLMREGKTSTHNKQLILGMGTGRCGSTSLTMLLREQEGCYAAHESLPRVPWNDGNERMSFHKKRFDQLLELNPFVGEVVHWLLPYFEQMVSWYPDVKAVVLKRDREEVIHSFNVLTNIRPVCNHWIEGEGTPHYWDEVFPKYDAKNKREALGMYWDDYYAQAEKLCEKYPKNIRVYMMEDLNSEEKQKELLEFLGFKNPKTVKKLHYNNKTTRDGLRLY